jgi:hypothetical protein
MTNTAASTVRLLRIERHHGVATFPNTLRGRVPAETDSVAESPNADQAVELPVCGGDAGCYDIGIVRYNHRSLYPPLAQTVPQQLLHVHALHLVQVRRFLDNAVPNDPRHPDSDRMGWSVRGNRLNLTHQQRTDFFSRHHLQALKRILLGREPAYYSYYAVVLHEGGCHVVRHRYADYSCHSLPFGLYSFASLFNPLNAAAL